MINSSRAEEPSILFILDASGSMKDKLGQEEKMIIAKTQMRELLKGLPLKSEVGLVAYGNQIGGCDSARIYFPLKKNATREIVPVLDRISPAGNTPIAHTIQQVGKHLLKSNKNTTEIVLVSDGLESCNGNPEEELQKLKDKGIKFKMHVLGIDLNPEGDATLDSLAKKGDGKYYSIKKPEEFKEALNQLFPIAYNSPRKIDIPPDLRPPYIRIDSIQKEDDVYSIHYEFVGFPDKKNHTVVVNIVEPGEEKKAILSKREFDLNSIIALTTADHTVSADTGTIRVKWKKDTNFKLTAELWEMDQVPTPVAVSETKRFKDAILIQSP
jgi:Ca-activated chloride channel family protein